jgi:site-specific DNA-cytosine methylase
MSAVIEPIPYDLFQITAPINRQARVPGDPCHTLAASNAVHAAICVDVYNQTIADDVACTVTSATGGTNTSGPKVMAVRTAQTGANGIGVSENISHTLDLANGQAVAHNLTIRRLTPLECERLQGFPDNWTDGQPDTTRYKQLGNAVTVNVIEWLANNLKGTI